MIGENKSFVDTLYETLYANYLKLWQYRARIGNIGQSIYERNWDVLLILDACRVDLIEGVENEYSFLDTPGTHTSLGSMSKEWLEANFTTDFPNQIKQTAYVTGNPYSEAVADRNFRLLDEVWKYAWDDELGTIPPRPITDRAISVMRNHNPERLVVHYMQPHYPFIEDPDLHPGIDIDRFGNLPWDNVWEMLRNGEVDRNRVLSAYEQNLRLVLDDVSILLESIDADRVAISSDHGNALGEYGIYGHPEEVPLASIREVPWYETTATDTGQYEPTEYPDKETDSSKPSSQEVTERLRDLGYY